MTPRQALETCLDEDHADAVRRDKMAYIERNSIPEPNSGCWIWLGGLTKKGYGISHDAFGSKLAHRVALATKGSFEQKLFALHTCDNPSCVNPDHLYAGTSKQNTADMVRRGRQNFGTNLKSGSQNYNAKLTEAQVQQIRNEYVRGSRSHGLNSLGKKFGVSAANVSVIENRSSWRSL